MLNITTASAPINLLSTLQALYYGSILPNMEYQKQVVAFLEEILDTSEWFIQSIPVEIGLLQRKSQGFLGDYIELLKQAKQTNLSDMFAKEVK